MKIITRGVIDWATLRVEEEDSYEYEGPIALAKDSGSPPQPVDPWTQAAAQYGLSTGTAAFNAGLNRTNQNNPLGSSYWSVNGGNPYGPAAPGAGGSGTNITVPPTQTSDGVPQPITANTSPSQVGMYPGGSGAGATINYNGAPVSAGTGVTGLPYGLGSSPPNYTLNTTLQPWAQNTLESPINTSGIAGMPGAASTTGDLQNTQDALYKSQEQYLKPEQAIQSEQLKAQLANEGATPGSPAYNTEMDRLSREQEFANSNARTQAITGAGAEQSRLFGLGSQSLQNQLAVRNAPISEYNALTGAPGAAATALTPDISGAFGQQYQGALAGYNANVASNNQTTGALDSAALMALLYFSDRRLKEDIRQVGKTDAGLPVYTYRFKGDPRTQMGVMAQDVEEEQPAAAFSLGGRDGPKMVNYGAIR